MTLFTPNQASEPLFRVMPDRLVTIRVFPLSGVTSGALRSSTSVWGGAVAPSFRPHSQTVVTSFEWICEDAAAAASGSDFPLINSYAAKFPATALRYRPPTRVSH